MTSRWRSSPCAVARRIPAVETPQANPASITSPALLARLKWDGGMDRSCLAVSDKFDQAMRALIFIGSRKRPLHCGAWQHVAEQAVMSQHELSVRIGDFDV